MKLEQINNYIVTAQQNRDNLIEELTRENKGLKNSMHSYQNISKSQKKVVVNTKSHNTSVQWITPSKPPNFQEKLAEVSTLPYLPNGKNTNQKRGSMMSIYDNIKTN